MSTLLLTATSPWSDTHCAPRPKGVSSRQLHRDLSDYRHASVHHGGGEYGRGPVHTNGIESFRALFKRGFRGTYHSMSPKHLHRYAREFEGRHNHKAAGALQHMASLVQGMEGQRLTYWELTSSPWPGASASR